MSGPYFAPYGKAPVHYPIDDPVRTGVTPDQTELLIVEGDSAARSVNQVRDPTRQSILALQGKPMNVAKATPTVALRNEVLTRFASTVLDRQISAGEDWIGALRSAETCRYARLVVLMDPDADGIHCGVLVLGFLLRYAPKMFDEQRVSVVRPPMFLFRIRGSDSGDAAGQDRTLVASNPDHAQRMEAKLAAAGVFDYERFRHRGLGSIPPEVLRACCVDPGTRAADQMSREEAAAAVRLFSGG
ncbi:toprim domain-containing protein [Rhodopirellula sp. P2]|uniref:toprim domain-containing protein n=1 Tax=Rhodopirellula sp. P2 TaxID=2127060 RepID=UPI002368A1B5|nr:toprim domain-containing protein [Rhodopirellula sp. P2]WDQ15051.1 toprim domain-containing protein [Rhodopirellula sp. P2]